MSNQIQKLKESIKKDYVKNFDLNLMKTSGFIPVDKRQSDIFVIINKQNLSNKADIEYLLKNKFSEYSPKFIPVESSEFIDLYNYVVEDSQEKIKVESKDSEELSAEEMLVSIGWITQSQLEEC